MFKDNESKPEIKLQHKALENNPNVKISRLLK